MTDALICDAAVYLIGESQAGELLRVRVQGAASVGRMTIYLLGWKLVNKII